MFYSVLAIAALAVVSQPRSVEASTSLTGYAWSETIGWISLNCLDLGTCGAVNYGITVADNGALSGFGWSEHIGWVSANAADLAGCPSGSCTATLSSNALTGWLKALSADNRGWDGWISLSGSNYGPTLSGGFFSGFAWGSDVVGWLDFSAVSNFTAPWCSVTFDKNPIIKGVEQTVVHWTSSNAISLVLQTIGAENPNTTGSITVGPLNATSTDYSGVATGSFGSTYSCPATLTAGCNPTSTCDGQTIMLTDAACNVTVGPTCVLPEFCSVGAPTCQVPSIELTGQLEAVPRVVSKNDTTTLYWNVTNATVCTVTGTNGDHWSGLSSGAMGTTSGAIMSATTYTLFCQGYNNANPPSVRESVTVTLAPLWREPSY